MRPILSPLLAVSLALVSVSAQAQKAGDPTPLQPSSPVLADLPELQAVWRTTVNRLQAEQLEPSIGLPWDFVGPLQAATRDLRADGQREGASPRQVLAAVRSLARGAFLTLEPTALERLAFAEALDAALPALVAPSDWPPRQGSDDSPLRQVGPVTLSDAELAGLTQGAPERDVLLERLVELRPNLGDTLSRQNLLALLPRLRSAALSPWQPPRHVGEAFRSAVTPHAQETD